jgi:DNA-binding protein Fis
MLHNLPAGSSAVPTAHDAARPAKMLLFVRLEGADSEAAARRLREVRGVHAVHALPRQQGHLLELQGIAPAELMPLLQEHFEAIPSVRVLRRGGAVTAGKRLLVYSPSHEFAATLVAQAQPWGCRTEVCHAPEVLRARIEAGACDLVLLEPAAAVRQLVAGGSPDAVLDLPLAEVEKRHILRVLASEHGNKSRTARRLGIDTKTLYNRLKTCSASAAIQRRRGDAAAVPSPAWDR